MRENRRADNALKKVRRYATPWGHYVTLTGITPNKVRYIEQLLYI